MGLDRIKERFPELRGVEVGVDVSDEMLKKMANLEVQVFGSDAFGEVSICASRGAVGDCGRVYNHCVDACLNCGSSAELVFDSEAHVNYLRWIFNHGVKGVLLLNFDDELVAFSLIFKGDFNTIFNEINYRKGYDVDQVRRIVQNKLGVLTLDGVSFACSNRIGIRNDYRGQNLMPILLGVNALQIPGLETLPALGDTMIRSEGKLFAPVVAAGYEPLVDEDGNVLIDAMGGVLLFIERFGDFLSALNLELGEFKRQRGDRLNAARDLQVRYDNIVPSPGERSYPDSVMLRPFSQNIQIYYLNPALLKPTFIKYLSDYFRYVFSLAFGQYVTDLSGAAYPVSHFFESSLNELGLSDLDSLDLDSYDGEMTFWHDPQITHEKIRAKLLLDSDLVVMLDQSETLKGFCFGYKTSLKRAYQELEEWGNPILYSGLRIEAPASSGQFISGVQAVLEDDMFSFTDEVYIFNAIAVDVSMRGQGKVFDMFKRFFSNMKDHDGVDYCFAEVKKSSRMATIFEDAGAKFVENVLTEDMLLVVVKLDQIRSYYT